MVNQVTTQPSFGLRAIYGDAPFIAGAPEMPIEAASGGKGAAPNGLTPAISWLGLVLALVALRVVYELAD